MTSRRIATSLVLAYACSGSHGLEDERVLGVDASAPAEMVDAGFDARAPQAPGKDASVSPMTLDGGSRAVADASPVLWDEFECPDRDDAGGPGASFGTADPVFGAAFDAAKGICEARVRSICGYVYTVLDDDGCVVALELDFQEADPQIAEVLDCMRTELGDTCSRCEADEKRRFYVSCTID